MRQIPDPIISEFKNSLIKNEIPQKNQGFYLKWLRYYLDFCHKYGRKEYDRQSLPDFINKLNEKKQTAAQQQQAARAINIYYGLIHSQPGYPQKEQAQQPTKNMLVQEPQDSFREPLQAKLQPYYSKPDSALKEAVQKDTRKANVGSKTIYLYIVKDVIKQYPLFIHDLIGQWHTIIHNFNVQAKMGVKVSCPQIIIFFYFVL